MRALIDRWLLLVLIMLTLSLWSSRLVEVQVGDMFSTASPWPDVMLVASAGVLAAELLVRADVARARRVAAPAVLVGVLLSLVVAQSLGERPGGHIGIVAGTGLAGAFLTIRTGGAAPVRRMPKTPPSAPRRVERPEATQDPQP